MTTLLDVMGAILVLAVAFAYWHHIQGPREEPNETRGRRLNSADEARLMANRRLQTRSIDGDSSP